MGILSQNQHYPDVIPRSTVADAISIPIFCPDFAEIQFTVLVDASADFDFEVLKSDQKLPPDPSLPSSPLNLYADVIYTDEGSGVNYDLGTPYNPATPGSVTTKIFKVQTSGARWIFLKLFNYAAGTLLKADVDLFSNFT